MTGKKLPRNANWYGVYDARTDRPIAFGTGEECRRQMGYGDIGSFYHMVHDVRAGRCKKYEIYSEKLREPVE